MKGLRERQGDRPGSGCRRDCLHRALVGQYRDEKVLADEARKLKREQAGAIFPTERREWDAGNPAWGFRDFLTQRAGRRVELFTQTDRQENEMPLNGYRTHYSDALTDFVALTDAQLEAMSIVERNRYLDAHYADIVELWHEHDVERRIAAAEDAAEFIDDRDPEYA